MSESFLTNETVDVRRISAADLQTDINSIASAAVSARSAHNADGVDRLLKFLQLVANNLADLHL